ncbi:patatin-like phospholipase domain-containing protein 2 [Centruroides sculpturatus]|uniref:patatin-like phospholipase domain-containing protein 2 n=1 Tax=Centruroides sculpturatus TaxID=218467 RepID=UPI000C6D7CBD|nr:patatin-like phospholipase domain-containing protein 2 [Centruroides sculpturatus]
MNISFSGCGFLCIYHVGVASCFKRYAPHILVDKIAGASAGALAACALICNVPLGESTSDVLRIAGEARARVLGPLHPRFDLNKILYDGLIRLLPEDAHLRCTGRLHVSLTRCNDGKNLLLSEFDSRDELIQALLCTCFIPFYSGFLPPTIRGVSYIDGGFSNNQPILDENTITVSPFAGESDICPEDTSSNVLQLHMSNTSIAISVGNLYRFASTLFPPHPEILSQICQQGFDDALKFLQRNNIISCTRCLAVQSSFGIAESKVQVETKETEIRNEHPDDDCIDCRYRRQMALLDSLPEAVVKAIQEASDKVNKGIINYLFRHHPIKILPFLVLPYVLPFELTFSVAWKVWKLLPFIQAEMKNSLYGFVSLAKGLLNKFDSKRHQYSAKFSCQLAITEFDYANKDMSSILPEFDNLIESTGNKELSWTERNKSARQKRMSYAGFGNTPCQQPIRRKSMVEIMPERVIKNMKFGFTVDLAEPNVITEKKKKTVIDAFKNLENNSTESNPFDIASKVLDWEKDYIEYIEPENADSFEQALEVTNSNEAVMAFFYKDDKNVKVTEIFNISEDNNTISMTDDEKELNSNLQWDSDYDMCSSSPSEFEVMDYSQSVSLEDNIIDSSTQKSSPFNLETVDSYSREVHAEQLRRTRKKSVLRKSSFIYADK